MQTHTWQHAVFMHLLERIRYLVIVQAQPMPQRRIYKSMKKKKKKKKK